MKNFNDKEIGWKWFEFIKYVKIPASILIYSIILVILVMQLFSYFDIKLFIKIMICIYLCISNIIVLLGFKNMRRYAIYIYYLIYFSFILLEINFFNNIFKLILDVCILLCEIYYLSKRKKFFN